MVDWDADAVSCPENHLKIPRWDGDMNDKSLMLLGDLMKS